MWRPVNNAARHGEQPGDARILALDSQQYSYASLLNDLRDRGESVSRLFDIVMTQEMTSFIPEYDVRFLCPGESKYQLSFY